MSYFNSRTVTLVGDSHYHREFIQQVDRLIVAGKLVQAQSILDPVTENSLNGEDTNVRG